MKPGTAFEQLAALVFGGLSAIDLDRSIEVSKNITLQGKTTRHEIDVYWRLPVGAIFYETVIQAKDWNRPVEQGEVLKFKAVLDDLPNQPRGVMVSRYGFQEGASNVADGNGILLFTIKEIPNVRPKISMVIGSSVVMKLESRPVPVIEPRGEDAAASMESRWFLTWRMGEPKNLYLSAKVRPTATSGSLPPLRTHEAEVVAGSEREGKLISKILGEMVPRAMRDGSNRWSEIVRFEEDMTLRELSGRVLASQIYELEFSFDVAYSTGEDVVPMPEVADYFVSNELSGEARLVRVTGSPGDTT